jgi:hypothetical protein
VQSNQKQSFEDHLRALLYVCTDEHAWIGVRIKSHLESLLTGDGFKEVFEKSPSPDAQALCFKLEEQMESMKERQLLEDVSDALTRYTHVVARERLGTLGELLKQAELDKDEKKAEELLTGAKKAEKLLQVAIVVEKEV